MSTRDLYGALGVGRDATPEQIKSAYRNIAKRYHPDKNPGDAEAERIFKEAAEAYRVLSDPDRRKSYDRGAPGPQPIGEDPMDLFTEIFGTRRREKHRPKARSTGIRGDDLRYTLELDFEQAALGTTKEIAVPRRGRCGRCGGTGAKAGTAPSICSRCGGTGTIEVEEGFFSKPTPCAACGGAGRIIPERCEVCGGSGETKTQQRLEVKVPAGVGTGTRLKLSGEGEAGANGGPSGDLFIVIEVRSHPFFQREGNDVVTEVPIRLDEAALGATIDVPTLEGKVRMRVPPGSEPGRVFRLKGKGLPSSDGKGRGDQRVVLAVEIPEHLSAEQKALLERFGQLEEERAENAKVRNFRAALRDRYRD